MEEFSKRRTALMQQMKTGIAIVPGARMQLRNGDVDHPFRQNSDFFYLTGLDEPDCVLVLTPGHSEGETHLFVRPKDPLRETWD